MPELNSAQLNIRSRFARERAALLAAQSGMTITQVVEEALRSYLPPMERPSPAPLIRKGALLVKPSGGRRVTLEEANAAMDETRDERGA